MLYATFIVYGLEEKNNGVQSLSSTMPGAGPTLSRHKVSRPKPLKIVLTLDHSEVVTSEFILNPS